MKAVKKGNKRNRAILISGIAMLLCFVMLLGTTFAWFSDTLTSSKNRIVAGTLDVDLEVYKDGKWVSIQDHPNTKVFNYDKWEPGYTEVAKLRVVNRGSLAFKWKLTAGCTGDIRLGSVIDVWMGYGEKNATTWDGLKQECFQHSAKTLNNILLEDPFCYGKMLADGQELPEGVTEWYGENGWYNNEHNEFTIALHMHEEAGNEYQGMDMGEVFLTLEAGQMKHENDSFGNDYDVDAPYYNGDTYVTVGEGGEYLLTSDVILKDGKAFSYIVAYPSEQYMPGAGYPQEDFTLDGQGHTVEFIPEYTLDADGNKVATPSKNFIGVAEGYTATLKNITLTGAIQAFGLGGYHGNYIANNNMNVYLENVTVKNMGCEIVWVHEVSSVYNYGNTTLKNCVMTGSYDNGTGEPTYDLMTWNYSKTYIDGGEYGAINTKDQAHMEIKNAKVGTIDSRTGFVNKDNRHYQLILDEGAEVDTVNIYLADTKSNKRNITVKAGATLNTLNICKGIDLANIHLEDGATVGVINVTLDDDSVWSGTQAEFIAKFQP